jgi:hypothetical protein
VNLDPGYVSLSKLVLATTKDYSHRIYVGSGMYAESALHFENGQWTAWPWTYPDYAGPRYHAFFGHVRELYKAKLNVTSQSANTPSEPGSANPVIHETSNPSSEITGLIEPGSDREGGTDQ